SDFGELGSGGIGHDSTIGKKHGALITEGGAVTRRDEHEEKTGDQARIGSEADGVECGSDGFRGGICGAADGAVGFTGGDSQRGEIKRLARKVAAFFECRAASAAAFEKNLRVGIETGTGGGIQEFDAIELDAKAVGMGADNRYAAEEGELGATFGCDPSAGVQDTVVFAFGEHDALDACAGAGLEAIEDMHGRKRTIFGGCWMEIRGRKARPDFEYPAAQLRIRARGAGDREAESFSCWRPATLEDQSLRHTRSRRQRARVERGQRTSPRNR